MHFYPGVHVTLPLVGTFAPAKVIAASTAPVCFYKNVVNLVQLWKGSKILVGVDLTERAEMRAEEEYWKQHKN